MYISIKFYQLSLVNSPGFNHTWTWLHPGGEVFSVVSVSEVVLKWLDAEMFDSHFEVCVNIY